jgi:hypothetical protein
MPAAMADNSMASVLSFLPNTTYDLPACDWNDYRGHLISSAGDINGDGLDDLIIGVYEANPNDKSKAGKSYVVFGKKDNTGDLPACDLPLGSACLAPIIKSSKPSPLTSPALETE